MFSAVIISVKESSIAFSICNQAPTVKYFFKSLWDTPFHGISVLRQHGGGYCE